MHIVLHGPRRLAPRFYEVCSQRTRPGPGGRGAWLSENWVDGFDNGENELDWIL